MEEWLSFSLKLGSSNREPLGTLTLGLSGSSNYPGPRVSIKSESSTTVVTSGKLWFSSLSFFFTVRRPFPFSS